LNVPLETVPKRSCVDKLVLVTMGKNDHTHTHYTGRRYLLENSADAAT
jgi:hypothetical protein